MSNWLDEILAGLANYIVESIHLEPSPVKMVKLNQRQAKQAIQDHIRKAIGEDEKPDDDYEQCRDARNELRAELRKELLDE